MYNYTMCLPLYDRWNKGTLPDHLSFKPVKREACGEMERLYAQFKNFPMNTARFSELLL